MNVIVACEFTGTVRDAFLSQGHNAISCDLLPTENPGPHIQDDIFDVDLTQFDLMVAHPPCTHLACSGARWFKDKPVQWQKDALAFVARLLNAPVPRIALENPVGVISSHIRKPDQVFQPYQFGDSFQKRTCLWLKNLPLLIPTKLVDPGEIHITKSGRRLPKWLANLEGLRGDELRKHRSRFFPGVAMAMAEQWGVL